MDLYALYSVIRDGIARNVDLNAWAMAEFETPMKVFSGIPSSDFPEMGTDSPFVALGDPQDDRGQNHAQITYGISGWVGLTNDDANDDIVDGNVTEPQGVKQIIDVLRLIRLAMAGALPDNVYMDGFATASDTLGAHDEVNGYFEATFKQTVLIGQDPLN